MSKESFRCLQCATCCHNLIETQGNVSRGLPLTEIEKALFPAALVSPMLGVGLEKPEKVMLHQLNVTCCPHIDKQNCCQIYETRPLMCRSFPIVAGAISNRCRVFSYRKPGLSYEEPYTMAEQLRASEKLERHIEGYFRKGRMKGLNFWEYDLAAKKWHPRGKVKAWTGKEPFELLQDSRFENLYCTHSVNAMQKHFLTVSINVDTNMSNPWSGTPILYGKAIASYLCNNMRNDEQEHNHGGEYAWQNVQNAQLK
jgi:Fe-S-cluster containining protein